jgi:ligand-binding SRPBCC domain-containing protein
MRLYTLKREQVIDRSINDVFAFFEKPENLALLTPPAMKFTVLTPSPIEMKTGTVIDYSVRILGLSHHWTTLIADYDPPHRFADVQLKGPYTFWHHTHNFEETNGSTRMIDEVKYVLPFGFVGRLARALVVRRQLKSIFDYREEVIRTIFAESI